MHPWPPEEGLFSSSSPQIPQRCPEGWIRWEITSEGAGSYRSLGVLAGGSGWTEHQVSLAGSCMATQRHQRPPMPPGEHAVGSQLYFPMGLAVGP